MYRVLLVDDEILIRESISKNTKWNDLGYELAGTCRNGKEAIAFLEENPVDLVLTDIYMPYVDGMVLAKHIHENYKETKVVIISGYDEFEYAKQALKYNVVEYIVKPVTAMELADILKKIRTTLDEEHMKRHSINRIRGAYMSNLPVLRGRFLHNLIQGDSFLSEEEIRSNMENYNISFPGNYYMASVIQADDVSGFFKSEEDTKQDLALFGIYNIADEIIRENGGGIAFQDVANHTIIIMSGDSSMEQEMLGLCEQIRSAVAEFLNIYTSIGVGCMVSSIYQLSKSFSDAKHALEYRFLLGDSKVIYSKHLMSDSNGKYVDVSFWSERIVSAIMKNSGTEIKKEVAGFIQAIRDNYINKNRSIFTIQNAILSISKEMDAAGIYDNSLMEEERKLLNEIYEKEHLTDIAQNLVWFCVKVSDQLSDQKDSFGNRQAIMALDYIEKNYADPEISLNSVCTYLAISTSHFSTVFKNYTGETFIEALTKKRMEKAKILLENTSKRTYEIAEEVGYSDAHYFGATFKKQTGLTPKEYAKEHRKG